MRWILASLLSLVVMVSGLHAEERPAFTSSKERIISGTEGKTIARCGAGWLEEINGYPVLHLKGTPYEMGYQHGALLKEQVTSNMHRILNLEAGQTLVKFGPVSLKPKDAIQSIIAIQK